MTNKAKPDLPISAADDQDTAWQGLNTLLRERIAEGLAGGVSAKSIDVIVEEELLAFRSDT